MKLRDMNYFGFNHKAVNDKFGGDLEFVCEMPVPLKTSYGMMPIPCAIYLAHNPDRSKGHKDYLLLFSQGETYMVTGRSVEEMEPLWNIPGIVCGKCQTVLLSIDRHHFVQCECHNETFLDGGMHYQRIGGKDLSLIGNVLVNMKTKQIKLLT